MTAPRRRPTALSALVLSLALALSGVWAGDAGDAAGASTATGSTFTFTGGGWGHGVGMSQWGAKGFADHGSQHWQILEHYYRGAKVTSASEGDPLRILIAEKAASLTLVTSGHTTFDGVTNLPADRTVTLTRSGNSIRLTGAVTATVASPLSIRYHGNPLKVSPPGNSFRHGKLLVKVDPAGGLRAIVTELPVNQYLWGLAEMPASWHTEALKAQVVAARTYALKRRAARRAAGSDFDLYATTTDQVYRGTATEAGGNHYLRWVQAVEDTAGKVVTHGGQLIDAVYFSSSGGHTEHSENVWVAKVDYLRGVPDPFDNGAGNSNGSWTRTYTGDELGSWFGVGTVTSITISGTIGVSGRVDKATVRLVGTSGTKQVTGASFRSTVNARAGSSRQLMSTKFTVTGSGTPAPPPANRPPTGSITHAHATGRRIVIAGHASDPDGPPLVKVTSTMGSQRATRTYRATGGSWLVAWDGAPGTRKVCVTVVDVPTGAEHSLGCRNVVVK